MRKYAVLRPGVVPARCSPGPGDQHSRCHYPQTRKWAAVAYAAGFDCVVWMSHQINNSKSWMVFGDRMPEAAFTVTDVMALGGASFTGLWTPAHR